jgi:aspartate aminotransferase
VWRPRPQGAFYVFLRYDLPIPAPEAQALLDRHGVRVRFGTEYGPGGESHVRLSFAASREAIAEGLRRVKIAFEEER